MLLVGELLSLVCFLLRAQRMHLLFLEEVTALPRRRCMEQEDRSDLTINMITMVKEEEEEEDHQNEPNQLISNSIRLEKRLL